MTSSVQLQQHEQIEESFAIERKVHLQYAWIYALIVFGEILAFLFYVQIYAPHFEVPIKLFLFVALLGVIFSLVRINLGTTELIITNYRIIHSKLLHNPIMPHATYTSVKFYLLDDCVMVHKQSITLPNWVMIFYGGLFGMFGILVGYLEYSAYGFNNVSIVYIIALANLFVSLFIIIIAVTKFTRTLYLLTFYFSYLIPPIIPSSAKFSISGSTKDVEILYYLIDTLLPRVKSHNAEIV